MGAADATASRERRDDGDVTDDDVNDDVEHVNIIKVGYALTAKKASRMLSDALVARCRCVWEDDDDGAMRVRARARVSARCA